MTKNKVNIGTLSINYQYKDIYDKNSNLIILKKLIQKILTLFILLICFSVNNSSTKNNLIMI